MSGTIPFQWLTDTQKVKFTKYQMNYIDEGQQENTKRGKNKERNIQQNTLLGLKYYYFFN